MAEKRPLYELRFGPLTTGSRPCDVDPTEVSTVTDQWEAMRYEPVVEEVWYLHGVDYDSEWPCCDVVAYGHVHGDNIPKDDVSAARAWAERLVPAISRFHVNGWDGLVPQLIEYRHELAFEMSTGTTIRIEVDEDEASRITNAFMVPASHDIDLADGLGGQVPAMRDAIVHRLPDQGDGAIRLVRINLTQVVTVHETIRAQRAIPMV